MKKFQESPYKYLMGKYSATTLKEKFDSSTTMLQKDSCKVFHRETYVA